MPPTATLSGAWAGEACGPGGADYAAFLRSRPPRAETAAIEAVIETARHTGVRAHILHVSSADAIDLLILLREKTEGHRSPEESRILDEVLYDLQLRYVHATKRS